MSGTVKLVNSRSVRRTLESTSLRLYHVSTDLKITPPPKLTYTRSICADHSTLTKRLLSHWSVYSPLYGFFFLGSTVERERCPYVFMANSQTDMEEWVRALRKVTGVPNGGLVKLHVPTERQELRFQTTLDILGIFLNPLIFLY